MSSCVFNHEIFFIEDSRNNMEVCIGADYEYMRASEGPTRKKKEPLNGVMDMLDEDSSPCPSIINLLQSKPW